MSVIFTRIDDRLIHGQVVEGWIPHLRVNEVVVVCNEAATDDMRKTLMRLSLPDHIALEIFDTKQGADYLIKNANSQFKTLVLTSSPKEVEELIQNGFKTKSVNVGGMHFSVGKMQIGRAIFLDDEDVESLKNISDVGVSLEGRGVPSDIPSDVIAMMEK
jgi:PTS system mannose-specific IIB component